MRSEDEVKQLRNELETAVNIDDLDEYNRVAKDKDFIYMCNVQDAFDWVLGKITTKHFKSEAYLNLEELKRKAKK